MKRRTRELARPGLYGSAGRPVKVTERDLREIAETFPDIGEAPVSLNGHDPNPASPQLGAVVSVTYDDRAKTLIGTVAEDDALAEAVDRGYYRNCSIGAKRRADGKMYLHHLAYLGEQPPAIKNLKADIGKKLGNPEQIAAADRDGITVIPCPALNLSDPADDEPRPGEEDDKETIKQLEAEITRLREQLEALAEKYPDEGITLADRFPMSKQARATREELRALQRGRLAEALAGKYPYARHNLVLSLADTLYDGKTIMLSDTYAPDKTDSPVSVYEALARVFEIMPLMVKPGVLEFADDNGSGADRAYRNIINKG
ncbi:MAG: hypothetical protein LBP74_04700 [Treponema sp.]|jgi:hypothetical protein|nr:hypothetical protein [Treponema sp.]